MLTSSISSYIFLITLHAFLTLPKTLNADFNVYSDQKLVEKVIIDYLTKITTIPMTEEQTDIPPKQEEKRRKTEGTSVIAESGGTSSSEPVKIPPIAPATPPTPATSPSAVSEPQYPSMCQAETGLKVAFCHKFMADNVYPFEFEFEINTGDISCHQQKILLQVLHQGNLPIEFVNMFQCPEIVEKMLLPDVWKYFVSETHFESSAVVYIQKNRHSPIQPLKYVSHINWQFLHLLRVVFEPKNDQLSIPSTEKFIFDAVAMSTAISTSIQLRDIKETYKKFRQNYLTLSACGLRKNQKFFACRRLIHADNVDTIDIDAAVYGEYNCRRFPIAFLKNGDKSDMTKTTMAQFRCPSPVEYRQAEGQALQKFYESQFRLFSTNFLDSSMITYHLVNKEFLPEGIASKLSASNLQRIYEQARGIRAIPVADRIGQPPVQVGQDGEERYKSISVIDLNRSRAEEAIMQMHQHKRGTGVSKFASSIARITVTSLKAAQKMYLCDLIFGNQAFGFKMSSHDHQIQRFVEFYVRKLEYLSESRGVQIRCLECKADGQIIYNGLFLFGGLDGGSLIVMVSDPQSPVLIPIGVVFPLSHEMDTLKSHSRI